MSACTTSLQDIVPLCESHFRNCGSCPKACSSGISLAAGVGPAIRQGRRLAKGRQGGALLRQLLRRVETAPAVKATSKRQVGRVDCL